MNKKLHIGVLIGAVYLKMTDKVALELKTDKQIFVKTAKITELIF